MIRLSDIRYNLSITQAHILGKVNVLADAASRQFQVPNGANLLRSLSAANRFPALPEWSQSFLANVLQQSSVTWN